MTYARALEHYTQLKNTPFRGIYDCYENPSRAKERIYKTCLDTAITRRCSYWGITGYNSQKFTWCTILSGDYGEDLLTIDTGYGSLEAFWIDRDTLTITRAL